MRLFGKSQVSFLSGDASANVVGAVASLLLIVNEAQDIEPAVYDKRFAAHGGQHQCHTCNSGHRVTSHTLLARELRAAREQEQKAIRRVFISTCEDVRKDVPAYGHYVNGEIRKHGRHLPLIRTQYFCEEITRRPACSPPRSRLDAGRSRRAIHNRPFRNTIRLHSRYRRPGRSRFNDPEEQYLKNPGRDAVTLTIASVDISQIEILQTPSVHIAVQ